MGAESLEECANCGDQIGKLETPYVWRERIVCRACHAKLSIGNGAPNSPALRSTATAALPYAAAPPRVVVIGGDDIICPNPNCRYSGRGKRVAKGSQAVGCLLLLLAIVPGILYLALCTGYAMHCPRCGVKVRDA